MIALFLVCLQPPLIAKAPPVKKPAIIALRGSSLFLIALTEQSNVENKPPQTPKLPPTTGTRALIALIAPIRLSPYGEFLKPLIPCQTQPPMTYNINKLVTLFDQSIPKIYLHPWRRHHRNRLG